MELVSPLNVLSESFAAGLRSNPYLQNAKPAEHCLKESAHGKIVDAESSRVQLLAKVI
jgi:hypothetical protein